jgi:hypothetical protein
MAGGARRDLLTGVVTADWIPGSEALAVVRDPGGGRPWTVEFPAGTIVHETRAAWSLRVSPDGSRVAFFEGPLLFDSAPEAMVTVVDKSGRKSTLAKNLTGYGLAWTPSGNEVWFTATRPGQHAPQVLAATLSGIERTVHRAPDWLVLHDISATGRVLLSRNTIRINMVCKPPAEARERDLTWLLASAVTGLSTDGRTVIFVDPLRALAGQPTIFRRGMDGSDAVAIGEGTGAALSPDGKWVLASSGTDLVLWPTGAGAMIKLPKGSVAGHSDGRWLRDSKRIVFTGETGDNTPRVYVQEVPEGVPRAMTPDGAVLAGKGSVRDDRSLLARVGPTWRLFPIEGGTGEDVPALIAGDVPLQVSEDGRYVYTYTGGNANAAAPAAADVFRVELATGARVLWKTLAPPDPVGVEHMRGSVALTPDAQAYCYSYMRRLGDMYMVDGLK